MADTDNAEAETTNGFLGLFDGGEAIGSDGEPRGESGGEAGGSGPFCDLQTGLAGEGPDLGLGEASIA